MLDDEPASVVARRTHAATTGTARSCWWVLGTVRVIDGERVIEIRRPMERRTLSAIEFGLIAHPPWTGGGTFTDRHGVVTHESGTAISSNGLLHAEVVRRLGG